MDTLECISTRRSVRKFTGEKISEEELELILRAGFKAPSAYNLQPREYIVVEDQEILEKISKFHPHAKMLTSARTGIFVCGDTSKQDNKGFLVADSSAAIQNMLLASHSLGLGGVWCGIYDVDKLVNSTREILNLPDYILPIGLVVVGNTEVVLDEIDRYDENKVHYNEWIR